MKQKIKIIFALALLAPQPAQAAWYENAWNWMVEQKNVALCLVGIAAACAVYSYATRCTDEREINGEKYLICPGANLEEKDLGGEMNTKETTNLKNANLQGAKLMSARLVRADLTNANLSNANLTGAIMSKADLTDANLTGATLVRVNFHETNLIGAKLDGADLTDSVQISSADFTNATGTVKYGTESIGIQELIEKLKTRGAN